MKSAKSKVAIITGGGRGIGQEITKEFLKKNYYVYSLDKSFTSTKKIERNENITWKDHEAIKRQNEIKTIKGRKEK